MEDLWFSVKGRQNNGMTHSVWRPSIVRTIEGEGMESPLQLGRDHHHPQPAVLPSPRRLRNPDPNAQCALGFHHPRILASALVLPFPLTPRLKLPDAVGTTFHTIASALPQPRAAAAHDSLRLLTTSDIDAVAHRRKLSLHMDILGPFFRIRALDLQTNEPLAVAQGFVKIWMSGRILHLDSIRMLPSPSRAVERPVFGMALLLGAAAVRYGYDQRCTKAELLAINDTEAIHAKLVRYYTRMGFKAVYHVTGEPLRDLPHMLVWGGVGTRMDADVHELLLKWSPAFRRE